MGGGGVLSSGRSLQRGIRVAGVFHILCPPNAGVSCYESHPRLPQWFCARVAAGSGQPPSVRQPQSRPMTCLGNRMGRKGSRRRGPGDNVGLLSPVGCAFLALSVAEAPGRLNEPFVPHVKRPPGLMSLLLTHPAAAPFPVPQRESQPDDCDRGPLPEACQLCQAV